MRSSIVFISVIFFAGFGSLLYEKVFASGSNFISSGTSVADSSMRPNGAYPLDEEISDSIDKKVIIASGSNTLEITPLSSFNNGLLIQAKNMVDNKGIPVAFFINDTASLSFYTNSQRRLQVGGNGTIQINSRLLINIDADDTKNVLRANGQARIDTSLSIQAGSDTEAFVSIHRNTINFNQTTDDGFSPYTTTPTAWAMNQSNIPVFRMRHPLNVTGKSWSNKSIEKDFLILPYQYGMAIEYNGVVECWVGEWSIHKGLAYYDLEGKGNGWGGVLWVGDDVDRGGVRATARNNTEFGGNVAYGELSVEKFNTTPNGDFRFRLPSTNNQFQFIYGERGSNNIVSKLTDKGFFIPKVAAAEDIIAPEKGQVFFDSSAGGFKGYNGTQWLNFDAGNNQLITGSHSQSANTIDSVFRIQHGLSSTPAYYHVIATSKDAANISYVTADDTYIYIYYSTPPPDGDNNLSWNWQAKI
ncbi:MAG TPA: hypothetical protein PKC39_01920 [Ferruginibacter sp.]|nr:hypothetical protein [Ferruginibacter sp.]HMP19693.1 hypothetical protein [Ferruginibacter sp.]